MSTPFYWFKNIEVEQVSSGGLFYPSEYRVRLVGGNSTSHSSGNISPIQDAILEVTDDEINIPYISVGMIDGGIEDTQRHVGGSLIDPSVMTEVLNKVLDKKGLDLNGLRDRVEWMKELSEDGYYIAYGRD